MKKILVLLILSLKLSACPGLGFLSKFFGTPRQNVQANSNRIEQARVQEIELQKQQLEQAVNEELKKSFNAYHNNEITEQQLKTTIVGMYVETMFIFPPEKMKQLFPGIAFTKLSGKKQD